MIDTHAHLYLDAFSDDRADTIARARGAGVNSIINIGIDAATSRMAIDLAREHDGFHAAVGLHPSAVVSDSAAEIEDIASLARAGRPVVVAIGEVGLDYHWKEVAPEEQRTRLERQLELALELDLPVVFHCRDALGELLERLASLPRRPRGVLHCFSGGPREALQALDLGFHVSFAGNITYPKAKELVAAAIVVPLERLLLETDCPYLPPQPQRGRRNEPAFVAHTRDFLAKLKGTSSADIETATTAAAESLFAFGRGPSKPPPPA